MYNNAWHVMAKCDSDVSIFFYMTFTHIGAAVVQGINRLPSKPGVAGSIHSFTSLLDESLSQGPASI